MIAERLKLIRQSQNLSLEDLSSIMGGFVTKQALSKYEKGQDRPSPGVIRKLAAALQVPANSLIESPSFDVTPIAYRKAASVSKKRQEHYESLLVVHLEQAMWLRDLVEPGHCFDMPVMQFEAATLEEAEKAAERLRELWKLGEDPIPNLVDVLEAAGVFVVETNAEVAFGGLSAVARDENGKPCGAAVMVHSDFCLERQRLTLAHELAHVVLLVPPDVDAEPLAFRFGGAFLCPATTLQSDVGRHRSSILLDELRLLRTRYGMSMQALIRRMSDLGIISKHLFKEACIHFSRTGQRQHEEGQTKQGEEPQWMKRTVYRALGEGLLTATQAHAVLGVEVGRDKPETFVDVLRKMKPSERNKFIEAHLSVNEGEGEGLDEDWMNADLGGDP